MALKQETVAEESPYVDKFLEFFEANYKKEIQRLAERYPDKRSLEVDFRVLEQFDIELADALLDSPDTLLEAAENAMEQVEVPTLEIESFSPYIRFFNLPKEQEPLVREIGARQLGKLIAVEGIIRQITTVQPKLKTAVWRCRHCGNTYKKQQEGQELKSPPFCECRHRDFDLVPEQSEFIDNQRIQIQEPLEKLKGNEQAATLDVYVSDDLVNRIAAGDKTRFVGILRLYPTSKKTVYGRYLEAIHLEETEREFEDVEISPEEEAEIRKLAESSDIYSKLVQSIAPAIYGHDVVKESIILQLFGGVKKALPGDQVIRGNVHVLLVGDPGCLVADERVVLGNGAMEKIGNMGSRHLEEIAAQVLTGEGGAKRDIAAVFHRYSNQPVMEIVTESGKSIKGTSNHPLLCVSREKGHVKRSWKRLDEFKLGDKVAVVTGIPCTITKLVDTGFMPLKRRRGPKLKGKLPEKLTPELAAFLGYLVGDGWVRKYETAFVVADNEKEILEPLLEMGANLFSLKPSVVRRKSPSRKVWLNYASIYSEDIAQNLWFLKQKRIPDLVLKSGNEVAASFLRWLYTADGCAFNNGRGRRSISFKSKNVELLRDIQVLLLRFGIHSRIVKRNLFVRMGRDIIRFREKIGFASKKKQETLEKLAKDAKSFARFGKQRSEKIVKIIKHGPEDVFDIEVPGSHRFIANGIISHNTGKSQMLQAANNIAPKSIYTAGKTTSLHPREPIVLRKNGRVSIRNIGEFVDGFFCSQEKEIMPVETKVEALCMNPSTLEIEWKPIKFAIRHKTDEDLYRFTFETGREITVTGSHSIFTLENGEISLRKASELAEGDCALCPSRMPNRPEAGIDLKMAKLLGYYLADGHTNENKKHHLKRIGFTLNASETDIVDDIADASIEHFGKAPCVYGKGENGLRVTIYGKEPYEKMENILGNAFGLHAREKRVPETILNATEEERKAFIDAYFAGDAGVTKSKYLMSDLQYLFLENSIIASQHSQEEAPSTTIKGRQIFSEGETYRLSAPLPTKAFRQRYGRPPISNMPKLFRKLFLQKAVSDKYLRVHLEKLNNRLLLERLVLVSHLESASGQEIKKTFGKNSLQYFRKRKAFFEIQRTGRSCQLSLTKTGQKTLYEFLKVKKLLESDLGFIRIKKIEKEKFGKGFVYDVSVPGNESFVAGFGGVICHNSGVGLTASAVKDDFGEGGWTLKAGALVLSSGGICMVDELDKMDPEDRSAMHEAMEQGKISIAKAGIVTRFRSDTSILAAANPKMSRFEQYQPFIEQVNLPATLISRFDLFFMIKDVLDRTKDEAITAHILKTHKGGELLSQSKKKGIALKKSDQEDIESISAPKIGPEMLGKYISFARQNIFPVMSKEAIQIISEFYIGLRDIGRKEGSYAATHRQLEGLVRLAEASARVRLSDVAEKEDAERAVRLVKASLSDVVTDPETGKIDYDIIMTGQTHTQVTNMRKILSIVREKAEGQDMVPLQEVLNEAEGAGINKDRARDLIAKLEKNGELYRPRHNFLKPTQKE